MSALWKHMKIRTDCYTSTRALKTLPDYDTIDVEELWIDVGAGVRLIVVVEATDRPKEATSGGVNLGETISGGVSLRDLGASFRALSHL